MPPSRHDLGTLHHSNIPSSPLRSEPLTRTAVSLPSICTILPAKRETRVEGEKGRRKMCREGAGSSTTRVPVEARWAQCGARRYLCCTRAASRAPRVRAMLGSGARPAWAIRLSPRHALRLQPPARPRTPPRCPPAAGAPPPGCAPRQPLAECFMPGEMHSPAGCRRTAGRNGDRAPV